MISGDTLERTIRDSLVFFPRAGFERELLHALRALSKVGQPADLDPPHEALGLRPWFIVGSIASALGVGVAVYQWTRHHQTGRRAA